MANTTNLDLVKPAGTDQALISVLNSNSDKIDEFAGKTNDSLSAEQNGLAYIVGNTNTTGGTLVVGQFVYVKGHSTIAEGLRKVTASISANASITTSNTDACSEGGLNALNSNMMKYVKTVNGINVYEANGIYLIGGMATNGDGTRFSVGTSWTTILDLGIRLASQSSCICISYDASATFYARITASGELQLVAMDGQARQILQAYVSFTVAIKAS